MNSENSENNHASLRLAEWEVYSVKWKGRWQKKLHNHATDKSLDRQNSQTKRKAGVWAT